MKVIDQLLLDDLTISEEGNDSGMKEDLKRSVFISCIPDSVDDVIL